MGKYVDTVIIFVITFKNKLAFATMQFYSDISAVRLSVSVSLTQSLADQWHEKKEWSPKAIKIESPFMRCKALQFMLLYKCTT